MKRRMISKGLREGGETAQKVGGGVSREDQKNGREGSQEEWVAYPRTRQLALYNNNPRIGQILDTRRRRGGGDSE